MKRFDNLEEVRPFTKPWTIKIEGDTGPLAMTAKGALELRNYMSWLEMKNINSIVLSREISTKEVDQLNIKCSYYQLLLLLFDQSVPLLVMPVPNSL